MPYDIFICHASEDKEDIARPLADELRNCGLKVWYDDFTLKLGDSLRRSIDFGLANSSYGIVIISPNFTNKEWPQKELDGLVAREAEGQKLILPIWHNISADEVRQYSPILADRIAITSSSGINYIVRKILESINFGLKKRLGLDLFHGQIWNGLTDILTSNGVELIPIDNKINNKLLNSIDILFIAMDGLNTQKTFDNTEVDDIYNFVYDGGILICADQAWSWVDPRYGNNPLHTLPLNVLGKRLGFLITDKNRDFPEYFFTEIMSGIKNLENKTNRAPSEIEFQSQNAYVFMRDKRNKVIGGYFELGRGLVFVIGHKSILEENPKVILNILSYSAQKKYSNKSVFHSNILEEIEKYKTTADFEEPIYKKSEIVDSKINQILQFKSKDGKKALLESLYGFNFNLTSPLHLKILKNIANQIKTPENQYGLFLDIDRLKLVHNKVPLVCRDLADMEIILQNQLELYEHSRELIIHEFRLKGVLDQKILDYYT